MTETKNIKRFHVKSDWKKNPWISTLWFYVFPQLHWKLHSVEIIEFYSHDFVTKISWNQLLPTKHASNWFHEIFSKWEWISRFSTLCCISFCKIQIELFSYRKWKSILLKLNFKLDISRVKSSPHSVEITENYFHTFLTKNSWKQPFDWRNY